LWDGLSAATNAGSGALSLLTSKAYINLIRPKAKPIKTKGQQNNPENYKPTYLIRILISSQGSPQRGVHTSDKPDFLQRSQSSLPWFGG